MAIDVVANEVASNLEEVAAATRGIDTRVVSAFTGGIAFGALLGFYFGYRFNREKVKAEAFEESQAEVTKIREAYREGYSRGSDDPIPEGVHVRRVPVPEAKPSVEDIIEQKGYSTRVEGEERPLRAPVPISPTPERSIVTPPLVIPPQETETSKVTDEIRHHDVWNWQREKKMRNPNFPYIIHENEFAESDSGYSQTTYTYYAGDNVLVDTNDQPLDDVNAIVGLGNLRFGHGSQDEDIVHVRNDRLQLEMEITRVPGSYAEDVMGLDPSDSH